MHFSNISKVYKLVIPKILFILVVCSFNFYFKITWPSPNKITPTTHPTKIKIYDPSSPASKDFSEIFNPPSPPQAGGGGGGGCMPCQTVLDIVLLFHEIFLLLAKSVLPSCQHLFLQFIFICKHVTANDTHAFDCLSVYFEVMWLNIKKTLYLVHVISLFNEITRC